MKQAPLAQSGGPATTSQEIDRGSRLGAPFGPLFTIESRVTAASAKGIALIADRLR